MKSYTIHLIRHGVSQGNLLGQYIGVTDSPLAPQGAEQLRELKVNHEYPTAQAYFTSPLKRCVQSLKILYPHVQPVVLDGFRECNFGDWEGKTAQELKENPDFVRWVESGSTISPPNGEGGGLFMQRVCMTFEKFVESMMQSGTTSAVVVTHSGVIMSILSAYGLPRAKFYDWMMDSGCGYSLRITPGLWMRSMVAEVYATIPEKLEQTQEHMVIDLAREAAQRAYGENTDQDDETKG